MQPARKKASHSAGAVVTELRIHGVGGTTPEALLGVPMSELVAGDLTAGFFQSPEWIPIDGPADRMEAYSWGGITSRNRLRALWILLLPFALINVAGWMFPHGGQPSDIGGRIPSGTEKRRVAVLRVFGLLVTTTYAAVITSITVAIFAGSCRNGCPDSVYFWPWRATGSVNGAVALSCLMAAATVLGIAYLTKRSQANAHLIGKGDPIDPAFARNLRDRDLWTSPDISHRLGLLHTAVAIASVGIFTATFARAVIPAPVLFAFIGLGVLGGLFLPIFDRISTAWIWTLFGVSLGAIALLVAVLLTSDEVPNGAAMRIGFIWLAGTIVALTMVLWFSATRTSGHIMPIRVSVPMLAILVTTAVGAGLSLSMGQIAGITISLEELSAVAVGAVVWLATAAVVVAVAWKNETTETWPQLRTRYASDFQEDDGRDKAFVRGIQKAQRLAAITDAVAAILWISAGTSLAATVVFLFVDAPDWLVTLGQRSVTLAPLALMYLIQSSWRDKDFRKQLAVVWDVLTFWPRWFHPWAPPSYGEKAVPHFRSRIDMLAEDGGLVLVSAHSQGTVVALAALADGASRPNVRLLTHGCPLSRLYERYFPEYFDDLLFASVAEQLGSTETTWINLWRDTDYIGGPIAVDSGSQVSDRHVSDPEASESVLQTDDRPVPLSHSNYFSTTAYSEARRILIGDMKG